MPQVAADYPSLNNLMILLPGLVGITLARNPNGIASDVRSSIRGVGVRIIEFRKARTSTASRRTTPHVIPELVGLRGRVTVSELRALERELGFTTDDCSGDV
jgi:hypothetical protein